MKVYDQAARFAITADPPFVLKRLSPLLGMDLQFRRWQPTKGLPLPGGPDREADLVAIADDPGDPEHPWLLIFENQSSHDPSKPKVLQLEALVFLVHTRDTDRAGGEFLPLPVFVYLKGECPEPNVAVLTPTGFGFIGKPVLWELYKDSAVDCVARVESGELSWSALFWVPLMAGAEQVCDDWHRLLQSKVPEHRRADVAYVALLFAELAGCRLAFDRVLRGVNMTESAVANEMIEMGEMRMARKDLLRVIRLRFPGILTTEMEQAIADQPSFALMKQWLDAAFEAESAEAFLAVLRR